MTPRPTCKRRLWRKRLTRAILCLLLGAVTTVGVAWACVLVRNDQNPWKANVLITAPDCRLYIDWGDGWGWGVASFHAWPVTDEGGPIQAFTGDLEAATREAVYETAEIWQSRPPAAWPVVRQAGLSWADVPSMPPNCRRRSETWAAGWPSLAFASVARGTWEGDSTGAPSEFEQSAYLPVFPGFPLDTLFYAAPWWLLLITPGAIRRLRRRRRGRCIHCGYDLTGLRTNANATPTCPECGSANS